MHFIYKIQCFEEFLQHFALIFKKLFFPKFRPIKSVFWPIEIAIKSFGLALCVSIDRTYFSINRKSYREFFKNWVSHTFFTIQTFFKTLSLSIRSVQGSKQDFCRFQPKFFKGFCYLRPVKPLFPSFFFYFQFSCIFVMHFGLFSNLREIGIFDDSSFFFGNWSMGFCYGTI